MKHASVKFLTVLLWSGICGLLPACGIGRSAAAETVLVYIDDGAAQCQSSSAKPLAYHRGLLFDSGVKTIQDRCGRLADAVFPSMCGAGNADVHVYEISVSDLEKAESLGFESVQSLARDGAEGYSLESCRS